MWTPYQHRARVKGVGVDCGGLVYEVYGQFIGPFAAFPETYAPDWAVHRKNELYLDFIMPYVVQVEKPVLAGLTLFQYGGNFSHAGIFTDKGTYIHAFGRTGVGMVKEDRPSFFRTKGGSPRPAKHFDIKA